MLTTAIAFYFYAKAFDAILCIIYLIFIVTSAKVVAIVPLDTEQISNKYFFQQLQQQLTTTTTDKLYTTQLLYT